MSALARKEVGSCVSWGHQRVEKSGHEELHRSVLDIAVRGTTAYLANNSNLFIADVTNPTAIARIGSLVLPGTIQGVDVDTARKLAVVAAGTNGMYVVDVSTPAAPVLRGSASTGNAHDVAIRGNHVFVADYLSSTTSVDISTPSSPVVRSIRAARCILRRRSPTRSPMRTPPASFIATSSRTTSSSRRRETRSAAARKIVRAKRRVRKNRRYDPLRHRSRATLLYVLANLPGRTYG